jgi:hypothetical protein
MSQAHRRLIIHALSLLMLATAPTFAAEKFSRIEFLVVRSYNGKPVRNASIVLHPVNKEGKQARNGVELKTDLDGKTAVDSVPYGKLRIQTIAPGLQTYGDDVEINEPQQQITIKMNRPKEQYSIYK